MADVGELSQPVAAIRNISVAQLLLRYLALPEGRTVKSAVLWVLGQHYDVFGWENPKYANPEAAAAIKGALHAAAPPPKQP